MYENLKKKYGLTKEQIFDGVKIVSKNLGRICDFQVVLAISDLLTSGDIKEEAFK